MSDQFDRSYFDAKFEGIEKLMRSEKESTLAYIAAVSKNATRANDKLNEHEMDQEAHGLGSSRNSSSIIASWLGLFVAVGVGLIEFIKGHK